METTKLDRLTRLRNTLTSIMRDCANDEDEWLKYRDILARVGELLTEERRKQGYMRVCLITDGRELETLFTGTAENCDIYVSILFEAHPEMRDNIKIDHIR